MRIRPLISVLAAASLLVATALTGCSLIDEDISRCNNQVRLTYQLELDPEIIQELEDELDLHADEDIRAMLKGYIDGIFTNYARDVDLFFYDMEASYFLGAGFGRERIYACFRGRYRYRYFAGGYE